MIPILGSTFATTAFVPSSIADLLLYCDGDTAPVVSGRIPSWTDLSGLGNHLTNVTTAQQPVAGAAINGKSTVHFAGSQILAKPSFALGPCCIYVVAKLTGTAGILYEQGPNASSAQGMYLYGSTNITTVVNRSLLSGWDLTSNWAVDGAAKVVRIRYDGTHAGYTMAINGANQTLTTRNGNDVGAAIVTNTLNVGARQGPTLGTTGDYRRILIYGRALTSGEDAAVTAWLRADAGV